MQLQFTKEDFSYPLEFLLPFENMYADFVVDKKALFPDKVCSLEFSNPVASEMSVRHFSAVPKPVFLCLQ